MVPKVLAICVAVPTVIILVLLVYVGCKLLRRSRLLPLAPASEPQAAIEPTSSNDLLGNKSCEPLGIEFYASERAAWRSVTTFADILKATDNLSEARIIGSGAFGVVYGGALPDGRRVATKRLRGDLQFLCGCQFVAEMETIGKVKHQNLVPLLGYYALGDECFLIYKHMHHGSLETLLKNQENTSQAIGWPDRLKICLGSACGLVFLHHGHIVHGDVKSSNILLDEHMQPRVSEFGLAKVISGYDTYVRINVSDALGYIPPDYSLTMKCTAKGDVYSFGVVILEVLTGRPAAGHKVEEGGGHLAGWVRWMIANGREGELFDPYLPVAGLWRERQMVRVLALAQECTADEPWKRPTMGSLVKELEMVQLMEHEPPSPQVQA